MKSHVSEEYLELFACLLQDARSKCYTVTGLSKLDSRDLDRLRCRVEHEGLSFMTLALPNFGKDFERCLAKGKVDSKTDFLGWKKVRCLPVFLRGFTSLVFDNLTGKIKEDPDVAAIEAVRQLAYCYKKLKLPCTPQRETAALKAFADCEAELSVFKVPSDYSDFLAVSRLLWGSVFRSDFMDISLIPKHGPGATAERVNGNRKYAQYKWHERLEPFFPYDSFCYPFLVDDLEGQMEYVTVVPEEEELPVRVVTVLKTQKAPRVIAIEPVCMQYTQQALAAYIIKRLEGHYLTAGHINFECQSINRNLAMGASKTGLRATLDLSEASDRVIGSVVYDMLSVHEDLRDAIFACRSKRAKVAGQVLDLVKFASMGSALCFPIEAMYFFTLIVHSLLREAGLPVTLENICNVSRDVYVYGDDIIVPVDAVEMLVGSLQEYKCKLNTGKSFWTGKFRESCGMDAYDGYDVTPTYLRMPFESSKQVSSASILSWTATSNLLYQRGYWSSADYLKRLVEKAVGFQLPLVSGECEGIGWQSYQGGRSIQRWNKELHRFEVRTLVATPVYEDDHLGGWPALLKFFLTSMHRRTTDRVDEEHLGRSPRHGAVSMKRRWVAAQ